MSKYPEQIDQLDNFYQSEFANVEELPPADMWDRISASLEDERNKKGGFSSFTTNQKSIGIVILLAFIGVSTSIYLMNKEDEPNKSVNPIINTTSTGNNTTPINKTTAPQLNNTTTNASRSLKTNTSKSTDYTATENNSSVEEPRHEEYQVQTIEQPKAEELNNVPVEKTEEPVENTSKKKVSFKDKHKQGYQDSTRSLFVPGK
jgi:hypothetical protein